MQVQGVETTQKDATLSTQNVTTESTSSKKPVITKIISEESKSLFEFNKRQLLSYGYKMVGDIEEQSSKGFWSFLTGPIVTYTARFEKNQQ